MGVDGLSAPKDGVAVGEEAEYCTDAAVDDLVGLV